MYMDSLVLYSTIHIAIRFKQWNRIESNRINSKSKSNPPDPTQE